MALAYQAQKAAFEDERDACPLQELEEIAERMREAARANGIKDDMSMEEIDEIIAECRREWREKE